MWETLCAQCPQETQKTLRTSVFKQLQEEGFFFFKEVKTRRVGECSVHDVFRSYIFTADGEGGEGYSTQTAACGETRITNVIFFFFPPSHVDDCMRS